MGRDVELYPGVIYQTHDGSYRVVFTPFPSETPPDTNTDITDEMDNSFFAFSMDSLEPIRLKPTTLGTGSSNDIIRLLPPLSRDQMITALDFSDIPQGNREFFREGMTANIDANLAWGRRNVTAPNLPA